MNENGVFANHSVSLSKALLTLPVGVISGYHKNYFIDSDIFHSFLSLAYFLECHLRIFSTSHSQECLFADWLRLMGVLFKRALSGHMKQAIRWNGLAIQYFFLSVCIIDVPLFVSLHPLLC